MARNYAQSGGSSTFKFPGANIYNVAPGGDIPLVPGQPCVLASGPVYIPAVILTGPDPDGSVTLSTRGILTVEEAMFINTPVPGEAAYLSQDGTEFQSGNGWGVFGVIIDVSNGWVQISLGQFGWT